MFKITSEIQEKLLKLPESGLGYQLVLGTRRDRAKQEYVILNATIAEPTYERHYKDIFRNLTLHGMNAIYKYAEVSKEIIDVELIKGNRLYKFVEAKTALYGSKGAIDAKEEYTKVGDYFIRFSHYHDDLRVDRIRMCLLPNSYATTFDDADYCLSHNIDPRDRYALPTAETIEYKFYVEPRVRTPIKKGTVDPANDRPGGGVEVLFTKGTDDNTITKIEQI